MQKNNDVRNIYVTVEGSIDFSKATGISNKERSGFQSFNVGIKFDATMSDTERDEFIKIIFECGASIDNIQNTTQITYEILE